MVYKLMVLVAIIILALVFINPLKDVLRDVRDTDQLDCTNSSISFGEEATCLITDLTLPYFVMALIIFGFIFFFSKKRTEVE